MLSKIEQRYIEVIFSTKTIDSIPHGTGLET